MDLILIMLGILGSGAVVIATYIFTVAARNYASQGKGKSVGGLSKPSLHLVPRSATDRRQGGPVTFPLAANGVLVTNDRRTQDDRRAAA
ncbi:MAG: hypothetical protein P8L39_08605 [Halioglobus sp.]|nr:hypothetical protein [Halioglobus sp.]